MKYLLILFIILTTPPLAIFWRWSFNHAKACHKVGGHYALYSINGNLEAVNQCSDIPQSVKK